MIARAMHVQSWAIVPYLETKPMSLHDEFAAAVDMVRDELGEADIGHFHLSITAEGRTQTGCASIKIEYKVGEGSYSYESVTGDSIENCVTEYLRRKGWTAKHAPLSLTHDTQNESV